jgi:hypothetical protein
MTRPAQAERKAARKAAKRLLKALNPAARAVYEAMEVGAEAIAFAPDGAIVHLRREGEHRFIAAELQGVCDATDVVMGWHAEERAAEAVQ